VREFILFGGKGVPINCNGRPIWARCTSEDQNQEAASQPLAGNLGWGKSIENNQSRSDADQPFWSPEHGDYFLIWNGEIYNYKQRSRKATSKMGNWKPDLPNQIPEVLMALALSPFGNQRIRQKLRVMFSGLFLGTPIRKISFPCR